jgi:hypothetical protein
MSEFQQWQRITSDQKEIKRCAGMDDKKRIRRRRIRAAMTNLT